MSAQILSDPQGTWGGSLGDEAILQCVMGNDTDLVSDPPDGVVTLTFLCKVFVSQKQLWAN